MSDDRMDELIRHAARDYNRPGDPPRDEIWARIQRTRQESRTPASTSRAPHREWIWRGAGIAAVLVVGIGLGRLFERTTSRDSMRDIATTSSSASGSPSVGTIPLPGAGVESPASTGAGSVAAPGSAVATAAPRSEAIDRSGVASAPSSERRGGRPERRARFGEGSSDDVPAEGLAFRLAVLQHLAGTEAMLTSFRTSAQSGEVDAQLTSWARDLLRTTHMLQASPVTANDVTLRRLLDDLELVLLQIAQYTAKGPHRAEELELIEQAIDKRGVMTKLRSTDPAAPSRAGA